MDRRLGLREHSGVLVLEATAGLLRGKTFEVREPVCVIGKAPDCGVALRDAQVAPQHARIAVGLGETTLADLGSPHGTAVLRGAERLPVHEDAIALRDGDLIELGSGVDACLLRVQLSDEAGDAQVVSVKSLAEMAAAESALQDDPVTLRALYAAQRKIGRARGSAAVREAIATAAFDLVPQATHVTIVLSQDGARPGDAPRSYLPLLTRARPAPGGAAVPEQFVPITRSVYRKVLRDRAAVLVADAPQIIGQTASIMGASLRSCVAVPLWRGEEILGVLQVDNRCAPGMLRGKDLDALLVIAEHASLAIETAALIERLQLAEERLRHENRFLKARARHRGDRPDVALLGDSDAMRALLAQIDKVVDTSVTVLIEGETGTGKELVAAALHDRSRRRDKLFVAQNCAALAETLLDSELFGHKKGSFTGATEDKKGLFELADGSTLFLDEVTEAPMSIQSKLLRALQEGEIRRVGDAESKRVNVRVVAATNRNLEHEVKAGRFREDLYYRLKVFPLRVPALRERRSDIRLLAEHFLARYAQETAKSFAGITPDALDVLVAYAWPGNVRELQNEMQRVVIQADNGQAITANLLSPRMRSNEELVERSRAPRASLKAALNAVEKYLVLQALREHGGNKTNAARALGMTREGLHKKLRAFDDD